MTTKDQAREAVALFVDKVLFHLWNENFDVPPVQIIGRFDDYLVQPDVTIDAAPPSA